jgi:transcription factor S
MQFCPKCGTMMMPGDKKFVCPKCKYKMNSTKLTTSENIVVAQGINVLKEKDSNVWPTVSETCPKCGFEIAETWATQMRAGDEAETVFFRCKKCKNTWRERD